MKPSDMNKHFNKSEENNNETKNYNPTGVNKYQILVQISDSIKLIDTDGIGIIYQEVCDYENNNFPIRTLTLTLQSSQYSKIMYAPRDTSISGFNDAYKINIATIPLITESFLNKPFEDGEFIGLLQTSESNFEFIDTQNDSSAMMRSGSVDPEVTIKFNLYRRNELQFSLSNKTNTLYNNSTLSEIFFNSAFKTNPSNKLVVSKFDHNPLSGLLLMPNMSFLNVIQFLELEMGFYKTDFMLFLEFNLLFFLNKQNNINVNVKALERNIYIKPIRMNNKHESRNILKVDDYNYNCTTETTNIKIQKSSSKSFVKSYSYQTPSGKFIIYNNLLSRNTKTILKATEVIPLQKYNNIRYEYINVNIPDNSVNFINPLTKLYYIDSEGQQRIFRVCYKKIYVESSRLSKLTIKGFRLIENINNN